MDAESPMPGTETVALMMRGITTHTVLTAMKSQSTIHAPDVVSVR